jgi:hypothetical protein
MYDLKENAQTGVDWTHLADNRQKWWAFVNMIMNLQDSKKKSRKFLKWLNDQLLIKISVQYTSLKNTAFR